MTATTPSRVAEWVTSAQLSKRLVISRSRMLELETLGILRPGAHFVQQGLHRNSPKVWDLAAVEAALREHTTNLLAHRQS